MKFRRYKIYMNLVRYQGDLFFFDGAPDSYTDTKEKLLTRIKEKAQKHKFIQERYNYYSGWVDTQMIQLVRTFDKGPIDLYFVKYKGHYFRVSEETETEILLMTKFQNLGRKYGLEEPERWEMEYNKWVNREETTPIDQINEKLAYYQEIIFEILDKRSNEYLIASDVTGFLTPWYVHPIEKKSKEQGWELVGNKHQKWMPREKLYIYGEEGIPARI